MNWISVAERKPPWFENVIVYGRVKKLNVLKQIWQARLWTGWTSGYMKDGVDQRVGDWLTPCDYTVTDVTHWMPVSEPQEGNENMAMCELIASLPTGGELPK